VPAPESLSFPNNFNRFILAKALRVYTIFVNRAELARCGGAQIPAQRAEPRSYRTPCSQARPRQGAREDLPKGTISTKAAVALAWLSPPELCAAENVTKPDVAL
jgi:hypothetical protein